MRRRQDAQDEANWRDLQLERDGLLDPGQPTETATVTHRKRMRQPFTPTERQLIRAGLGLAVDEETT